jgi:hypothetical protein
MKEDLIMQLKRTVEGQNSSDCEVVLASRLRENERLPRLWPNVISASTPVSRR